MSSSGLWRHAKVVPIPEDVDSDYDVPVREPANPASSSRAAQTCAGFLPLAQQFDPFFETIGLQNARDLFKDVAGRAVAADLMILAILIVRQNRPRHFVVSANAFGDHLFAIVLASDQRRAIVVANAGLARRLVQQIVDPFALRALAARSEPAHQRIHRDIQMQHDGCLELPLAPAIHPDTRLVPRCAGNRPTGSRASCRVKTHVEPASG